MKHVLVTGGAGFIGSNIVDALLKRGDSVRILDDFSTGRRENTHHFADRVEIIEGSLTNPHDVAQAVSDIDLVFHQGAVPSVPRSIADPILSNEANVNGTLNLLIAARDAGVGRLVYASSSSAYGDQAPDEPKIETMNPKPISPYGVAKLAAEYYCQAFYEVYGFETVALRYFNVFGPRQDPSSDYAAVIPKFIFMLLNDEPPTIHGDGEQTRDFTYIGNVVKGNLLVAEAPAEQVAGKVFNLALGGQISINELVTQLKTLINSDIEPVHTAPRPGDIRHSRADVDKIVNAVGFEPAYTFEEGLAKTVEWYRKK